MVPFINYRKIIDKSLDDLTPRDVLLLAETARKLAECFGREKAERVKIEELEALYGKDVVEKMRSVVKIDPRTIIGKEKLTYEDIQPLVDKALEKYGRTREEGIPSIAVELVYGSETVELFEKLVKERTETIKLLLGMYRC